MAFANLAAFVAKNERPDERIWATFGLITHPGGSRWISYWALGSKLFNSVPVTPATPPTTAEVCDRATVGAVGQVNPTGGNKLFLWIKKASAAIDGVILVSDRLAHVSGFSGTVTTAQTVNTPALTRYTNGDRVMAGIEIYGALGGTATTFTMSYTNQAGTAGRVSQPVEIGATGNNAVGRLLFASLQQGDTGVRSVQSVTLAGTTGSVGNFGVVLMRPLLPMWIGTVGDYSPSGDPLREYGFHFAEVKTDACLQFGICSGAGNQYAAMELAFAETA